MNRKVHGLRSIPRPKKRGGRGVPVRDERVTSLRSSSGPRTRRSPPRRLAAQTRGRRDPRRRCSARRIRRRRSSRRRPARSPGPATLPPRGGRGAPGEIRSRSGAGSARAHHLDLGAVDVPKRSGRRVPFAEVLRHRERVDLVSQADLLLADRRRYAHDLERQPAQVARPRPSFPGRRAERFVAAPPPVHDLHHRSSRPGGSRSSPDGRAWRAPRRDAPRGRERARDRGAVVRGLGELERCTRSRTTRRSRAAWCAGGPSAGASCRACSACWGARCGGVPEEVGAARLSERGAPEARRGMSQSRKAAPSCHGVESEAAIFSAFTTVACLMNTFSVRTR